MLKELVEIGYHAFIHVTHKSIVLFVRNSQNNGCISSLTNHFIHTQGFMFDGSAQDKDNIVWSLYSYVIEQTEND